MAKAKKKSTPRQKGPSVRISKTTTKAAIHHRGATCVGTGRALMRSRDPANRGLPGGLNELHFLRWIDQGPPAGARAIIVGAVWSGDIAVTHDWIATFLYFA